MRFLGAFVLAATATLVRAADVDTTGGPPRKTVSVAAPSLTLLRASSPRDNGWVAVTPNFRIYWCATEGELRSLAQRCERLAAASKETWLGKDRSPVWLPQCDVVVHPDVAEYVQFLGPGSEQTSGCATIRLEEGRVVARRIDLRADGLDWKSETLPHELTHVVLADRFCRTQIPPWADEGIAMLSESPQKLKQRLTDLRQVACGGLVYTPRDLINVKSSPEPAFRAAFFGQSLAMVSLLLDCGSREQLLKFVEASQTKGFDAALRAVYGEQRWSQIDQQYRECLLTDRPLAWARQDTVAAVTGPKQSGMRPAVRTTSAE